MQIRKQLRKQEVSLCDVQCIGPIVFLFYFLYVKFCEQSILLPVHAKVNAFGGVCLLCVRVSVCPVRALTLEILDLETWLW